MYLDIVNKVKADDLLYITEHGKDRIGRMMD